MVVAVSIVTGDSFLFEACVLVRGSSSSFLSLIGIKDARVETEKPGVVKKSVLLHSARIELATVQTVALWRPTQLRPQLRVLPWQVGCIKTLSQAKIGLGSWASICAY